MKVPQAPNTSYFTCFGIGKVRDGSNSIPRETTLLAPVRGTPHRPTLYPWMKPVMRSRWDGPFQGGTYSPDVGHRSNAWPLWVACRALRLHAPPLAHRSGWTPHCTCVDYTTGAPIA